MVLSIGHRGARAHAPENTLTSFHKAIDLGADMVECDVRETKDGKIVVIHDSTINRTTNGRGKVKKYTLGQLKRFTIRKEDTIPSLEELIETIKGKCQLNVEVKEPKIMLKVGEILMKYEMTPITLIESDNLKALITLKQQYPLLRTALLFPPLKPKSHLIWGSLQKAKLPLHKILIRKLKAIHADELSIHKRLATKKFLAKMQEAGIPVNVWTVNKPKHIAKLISWGVSGIISDYPERVKSLERSIEERKS